MILWKRKKRNTCVQKNDQKNKSYTSLQKMFVSVPQPETSELFFQGEPVGTLTISILVRAVIV